jgi:antibiotic biosynthesis monooxygenase (ABM) superfamily enzyme
MKYLKIFPALAIVSFVMSINMDWFLNPGLTAMQIFIRNWWQIALILVNLIGYFVIKRMEEL